MTRARPPPITIPSATADRVAPNASSIRSDFSLASSSEVAPILMIATPPSNLESLSFRSNLEVSDSHAWI